MTKKNIPMICFVILLVGLSIYLNKDRFASDVIQLSHRSVTPRLWFARGPAAQSPCNPVVFLINKSLKLTSVKVVVASDAETNKFPHAIWDLVSDSNSVPVKQFMYGAPIGGMHLAFQGIGADPLQPGDNYRVLVQAGSLKLQHDFIPVPRTR
jgi:hypothetical protein